MEIRNLTPHAMAANCYAIVSGGHFLLVDPVVAESTVRKLLDEGLIFDRILLTHGHFDHIMLLDSTREKFGVPAYVLEPDDEIVPDCRKNAYFGLTGREKSWKPCDGILHDGDLIPVGNESLLVRSLPGHTKGSALYDCGDFLVCGDILFAESYGRTDLYSGSDEDMKKSLSFLRSYSPDLTVYPGHGQPFRLGDALDNVAYFL